MRFLIDSNRIEIAWPAVFRRIQFPTLSWRLIPALLLIGILIPLGLPHGPAVCEKLCREPAGPRDSVDPQMAGSRLLMMQRCPSPSASLESLEIEMVLGLPAGIYVVSTKIWDFIHWEPPLYDRATALCSIFLLLIFLLVWLHRSFLRGREFTTISGRSHLVEPSTLGRWRWLTCTLCLLFIAVMIILPLVTLVMGTFMEFFGHFELEKTWTTRHWTGVLTDLVFLRSVKNTLILGLGAAIAGTLVYALISYLIIRTRRGLINVLSWLPWALPGVLISLALLWTVLGSGDLWDVISFGVSDYHQRDTAGNTDHQGLRRTDWPVY